MARAAATDGVKTIVATPRWEADQPEPFISFEECDRQLALLHTELTGAVVFKRGFALQFSPQLPDLVDKYGSQLALGGKRHLLVSLPPLSIPALTETVWSSLMKLGFSILLAHPECNPAIRRDPSRLALWVGSGIMLQLDASSVTGVYGRDVKRFSFECLRMFSISIVLASNSRPGGRSSLRLAREEINGKVGAIHAGRAMYLTPSEILDGNHVNTAVLKNSALRGVGSLLNSLSQVKAFRRDQ